MGTYFCQVAVIHGPNTIWQVKEFDFQKGRYEIGVKTGLASLMFNSFRDHFRTPRNVRRTAIHRMYQRRFVPQPRPGQSTETTRAPRVSS